MVLKKTVNDDNRYVISLFLLKLDMVRYNINGPKTSNPKSNIPGPDRQPKVIAHLR